MITKLLLATDGSPAARKAARYAIALARQLKASLIALSVIDKRAYIGQAVPGIAASRRLTEPIDDYLIESAKGYLNDIKKLCDRYRIKSKTIVTSGHPVEEIVKTAERAKVSLIVMGSHGRSTLEASVLGSVTYGVIHRDIKIPVMVVRG